MSTKDNPSQHEANKVVRVLNGTRLKYTIRVYKPDGQVVEWQANEKPKVEFNIETRSLWLVETVYGGSPVMAWVEGSILLVEENPKE